jgi:hypothetical protein
MENENLEFEPPEEDAGSLAVNTSRMLFVAGGAFEELYDAVLRRVLAGTDAAPLRPIVVVSSSGEVREELPFHLREHLRYEDLFQYGITPQFLSRFESIVVLNDLVEDQLARIFVEPENSIFRDARDYFRRFGIDLQITRGAIRAIAWEASRHKRLGARALREIFRKVIRDLEFAPAAPEGDDGRRILMIDEEKVREKSEGRRQKAEVKASQKPEARSQKKRRSKKTKARSQKKGQDNIHRSAQVVLFLIFLLASGFWLRLFFWLLVSGFWLVSSYIEKNIEMTTPTRSRPTTAAENQKVRTVWRCISTVSRRSPRRYWRNSMRGWIVPERRSPETTG